MINYLINVVVTFALRGKQKRIADKYQQHKQVLRAFILCINETRRNIKN